MGGNTTPTQYFLAKQPSTRSSHQTVIDTTFYSRISHQTRDVSVKRGNLLSRDISLSLVSLVPLVFDLSRLSGSEGDCIRGFGHLGFHAGTGSRTLHSPSPRVAVSVRRLDSFCVSVYFYSHRYLAIALADATLAPLPPHLAAIAASPQQKNRSKRVKLSP